MNFSRAICSIIIFLMKNLMQQYTNDQLFGKVFTIFAGFAIFIACLGLFGLSLFATTQRTKEIGVRKVLGASVIKYCSFAFKRFYQACYYCFCNCIACGMVDHAQLAAGFCLPYQY